MGRALADTIRRAHGEEALVAQFQIYALADPELRAGLGEAYAAIFAQSAAYLATMPGAGDLAMPPHRLAVALQAVALGLTVQSFLTPGEVTDTLIEETLRTFAAGLSAGPPTKG
jgi:hypothetical protein